MTQQTEKMFLEIPDVINFGEEENVLDYDKIVEQTNEAKKKLAQQKKVMAPKQKVELTPEENKIVDGWVKDLEKHIHEYTFKALDKFVWNCAEVSTHLFLELAERFKLRNPKFYVERWDGNQQLVVTWHGKNEV